MTTYSLIVAVLYAATAIRLFIYRRDGTRYRIEMGMCAYLLFFGCAYQAIQILIYHSPTGFFDMPLAIAVAFLVFRARGNVARLIKREA